jgi:enoyl-CoA hydratase/carnithine racemase
MVTDGPYKIQINEIANKIMVTTWINIICRSAIPPQWWKEAILHAHLYTPKEAFEKGIADDLIAEGSDVLAAAKVYAQDLFRLDARAYRETKKVMRQQEVDYALQIFEKEILGWLKG